ncbi:GNAT family N-acetyltransferase [Blastococcus sp. TF02A-26]|uniref:GNAT family N-acetyltransferase n=1 Tax=Blastococcus sp. TF02A-26 TaxID=2250577 RepID=UPI001F45BF63|nr:GNAT family N-acetyltransferase [Blastococcus sp. TF02A-26]
MSALTTRPLTLDDAPAAAELLAAAEPVDDTGEHEDAADLAEWWGGELVDLERDGRAVCTDDGRLVGWATSIVSPGVRDALRVWVEGRVHPEHRGQGIGGRLLDWQVDRGAQQHAALEPAAPARLVAHVHPAMGALETLVRRRGFAPERYYAVMRRGLDDLPEPRPVAGVDVVPFAADRDDEVRRAHNASFTEHHGSVERDEVAWRSWFTGQRAFRPDLSVLALSGGAVVGYVLAYEYDADTQATGVREVRLGQIGVLPAARGGGVATAAIAATLRTAAAAGCTRASLDVDTENTTGAFGLYERLGFRTDRTWTSWALALPPLP